MLIIMIVIIFTHFCTFILLITTCKNANLTLYMWNKKIIYKQNLYFTKWVDSKQCTATLIGLGTELGSTVEEATEHITYTSTAPTYEAAVLTFGHAISPLIIIPPRDPSFTVYGTCGSTCTAAVSFQILSNMIHFSALTPILGCPSCSYQYILHTHLVGMSACGA